MDLFQLRASTAADFCSLSFLQSPDRPTSMQLDKLTGKKSGPALIRYGGLGG